MPCAERGDKSPSQRREANERPVTKVNPRRHLDRFINRKGGEAELSMSRRRQQTAEPENCGPASEPPPAGLLRGIGDWTFGRQVMKQVRPSLAALEWESRCDKAEPKRD